MRFGLLTPVVYQPPGQANAWEADADTADIAVIARAADELGYHHLTGSEHVGIPDEVAGHRGAAYWDPLATLAFLAAHTTRIRLATHVLVLGYHHPLALVKQYGTLDRLSGGRVVLGLGVGTLREEFELIGAPFDDRGARADDALAALRASWGRRLPEYHGKFYDYGGFVIEPHSNRSRVPVWIGGRTARSLRRAVDFGDGWVPFGLGAAELRRLLAAAPLPPDFDVVLECAGLDPLRDPEAARQKVRATVDAGATIVNVAFRADTSQEYVDQLRALAQLFPEANWAHN